MTNAALAELTRTTAANVRTIVEEWRTRVRVGETFAGWGFTPIKARAHAESRRVVAGALDGLEKLATALDQMAAGDMARLARGK